jgi:transcriptional regulator with XRE-family HTH domain
MTQSELSRLAGLHVNTVNDIESGRTREPSVNKVNRLAAALGVTVESLCRKG